MSTGDHLHYELKPIRFNSDGTYWNVLQDNGTYGAIDPLPYMVPSFAVHINTLRMSTWNVWHFLLDQLSDWVRRQRPA